MKLVYLPNLQKKALDTLSHTFFSVLHALFQPYEVLMVFNAANSPALFLPRLLGRKIAINVDGLEWKRGKWGALAKRYYKFAEWLSTRFANRIVADSTGIQDYYRAEYGVDSSYIAYGAYINRPSSTDRLAKLGLVAGEYFLQITRFEPENNPLLTIEAYKKLKTTKKLVLVGNVPYESAYSRKIKSEAGGNILLTGFVYDKELLNELWSNCFAYIHGNEVGGTNPALLQSMASGCFTIAVDVSFSHDVLADGGIYYEKDPVDLARNMSWALENEDVLSEYKSRAVRRIVDFYSWDRVADGYEKLFRDMIDGKIHHY
jgi:glycosyltransferase involved in cell wall biosynthesis